MRRLAFPDDCSSDNDADIVCGVARNVDQDAHDTKVAIFASSGLIHCFMTVVAVQRCTLLSLMSRSASLPIPVCRKGDLPLYHTTREEIDARFAGLQQLLARHDRALGEGIQQVTRSRHRLVTRDIPWRMAALTTFKTKPTLPMIMTRRGFSTAG